MEEFYDYLRAHFEHDADDYLRHARHEWAATVFASARNRGSSSRTAFMAALIACYFHPRTDQPPSAFGITCINTEEGKKSGLLLDWFIKQVIENGSTALERGRWEIETPAFNGELCWFGAGVLRHTPGEVSLTLLGNSTDPKQWCAEAASRVFMLLELEGQGDV